MSIEVSLENLDAAARLFWQQTSGHRVFAFHGEMGAGKTTIITALCRSKGVSGPTGSPTFSIINEYAYPETGGSGKIYHIDLYRLKDEEEVIQAGVEDCVYSGALCLVEWPGKAPWLFDENTVHVHIQPLSETRRQLEIALPGQQTASFK